VLRRAAENVSQGATALYFADPPDFELFSSFGLLQDVCADHKILIGDAVGFDRRRRQFSPVEEIGPGSLTPAENN
jgi:hypothetical protein